MKLEQLYITNKIGCRFHNGLNIILGLNHKSSETVDGDITDIAAEQEHVDELTASEKIPAQQEEIVSDTNGIGKTLLVSVVKHVLGGDTEKAFTSSYFTKMKYWGILEISWGKKTIVVSRPLWRPLGSNLYLVRNGSLNEFLDDLTKAKIHLEEVTSPLELDDQLEKTSSLIKSMSKKEYQKYISKLENIDYSKSNITLSALLDFIVRDEKIGFGDPITRIRRAQWIQYRSIQYLFGLPASTEEICSKLEEEIADLRIGLKAMRKQLDALEITGDDKIENLKLRAQAKLEKTREDIKEVKVIPSLEQVKQEYQATRAKYARVNSDLNKKNHYLSGYSKNRKDTRTKSKAMTELLKVEEFYEDLIQFFPQQLKQNISAFQSFFDDLSNDREKYYTDLISELRSDMKFLKAEKDHLEPLLASLATQFRSSSLLRDISTLGATEEKILNEIRELDECRKLLLECENKEEKLVDLETLKRDALAKGKREVKRFLKKRRGLISLFHKLVSEIYGIEDAELAFEYNANISSSIAGRTEITCRIPSQNSHGRTYARVNIFDFVWFLGEKSDGDFKPGFLIHDGSYSKISPKVKTKMLHAICSRLEEQQYLITVNEGELERLSDWEKYVCCRLDGSKVEGKFFGDQFD